MAGDKKDPPSVVHMLWWYCGDEGRDREVTPTLLGAYTTVEARREAEAWWSRNCDLPPVSYGWGDKGKFVREEIHGDAFFDEHVQAKIVKRRRLEATLAAASAAGGLQKGLAEIRTDLEVARQAATGKTETHIEDLIRKVDGLLLPKKPQKGAKK